LDNITFIRRARQIGPDVAYNDCRKIIRESFVPNAIISEEQAINPFQHWNSGGCYLPAVSPRRKILATQFNRPVRPWFLAEQSVRAEQSKVFTCDTSIKGNRDWNYLAIGKLSVREAIRIAWFSIAV
jgi:hypothetical protein